jgi:hypothetical protein
MPPCCSAGGIFSVALSVTEPHRIELSSTPHVETCNSALQRSLRSRPLALPGALPYFVTGSCEPTTTVSGLSSRPDCSRRAITRPTRQFHYSLIVSSLRQISLNSRLSGRLTIAPPPSLCFSQVLILKEMEDALGISEKLETARGVGWMTFVRDNPANDTTDLDVCQ